MTPVQETLLDAILPHVAFDGWSDAAFDLAAQDAGVAADVAQAACPRRAVDLAVAYHRRGDAAMVAALRDADLSDLRFRDKVAHALRLRLEAVSDKEAVQRASALFALPHLAPVGAGLVWDTADAVWTALGDTSDDVNWYSKRATLSAVWAATVLYWLGDTSDDHANTHAFIDRRIDNVMQFEKAKAGVQKNPILRTAFAPLNAVLGQIKAPKPRDDLPGSQR